MRLLRLLFLLLLPVFLTAQSGSVFRDYNGNGVQDADEPFVSGVTVNAYATGENICGTATTSGSSAPNYSISGCTGQVRIEFELPTTANTYCTGPEIDVDFSSTSGGTHGTSVQFVDAADSNIDLAINNPEDYWDAAKIADPYFLVPCYVNGLVSGNNSATEAMVGVEWNDTGNTIPPAVDKVATFGEIGTNWGVGYQQGADRFFAGAFLKRHSEYGAQGAGGMYIFEGGNGQDGYDYTASFTFQGVTPSNGGAALDFGSINRNFTDQADDNFVGNGPNRDLDAFDKVGARAIGDVDVDGENNNMYFVNLFQNRLVKVDVSGGTASFNNATAAVLDPLTEAYDIGSLPGAPSCTGGNLRAFAVEIYRGKGYIGLVCDAMTSQDKANIYAWVMKFDPENIAAGFTSVIETDLQYYTENGGWHPWAANIDQTGIDYSSCCFAHNYPQPMISNIKFDEDGHMLVVFMNRWGHQIGAGQYVPQAGNTTLIQGRGQGDVQRACYDAANSSWTWCDIAGNFSTAPLDDTDANEIWDDKSGDGADESNVGSVLQLKGTNHVVGITMDPYPPGGTPGSDYFATGGLHWNDLSSGDRDNWLLLYEENWQDNLAKATGLGDMEFAIPNEQLEIGNLIWIDTNGDGIQTADEAGIDGIVVKIYQNGTQVGTTTTANGGQWYFDETNVNMGGATGLLPDTDYVIVVEAADFPAAAPSLTTQGTATDQGDVRDSDAGLASGNAEIEYTTGKYGENDHTLDIGFKEASCAITAAGQANLACDDNDTGSDGTDDFLTIDLNPVGTEIGTNYNVSVSSGTIAPATAAYGAATTFTLTGDLSAAADIVITITDDTDADCQFPLTITDPAPCSTPDPCSITAAGEANLACDDNDTGSDGTDDFLTIDLNPTGSMIGTLYFVSVSSGTIAPEFALYGNATSFTLTGDLTAAADVVITIVDENDANCQFLLTITDPAPCSTPDPCSITAAGEANLACDDNDTGSDGTDDFLTIDLNPTGSMLGTNYSVAVSSGTIAPATAAYGAATTFTITDDLSAAADIVITITDDVTGTCQFLLTITDPAPCSTPDPCSITAAGEANLACDDNDTGSDGTDDFLTIDLNPTGSMLGTNYSVAVSSGTIAPATAAYGAATTFTITDDLSEAADIVITITDDVTGTCQFLLTITDPAPCSTPQPCSITAAGEANLACDDNDTGSDDTDDFLTIDLNPTGSMLGTNYSVAVSSGTIAPASAAYGAATTFTITDDLSAAADIVITITDDVTGTCQFLLTITDPAPCSTPQPCSITAAGEENLACDDNDTGSDDTDDFLTIDLNPTGSMLGTNYSVSVSSGTIAPATAAYGAATSFTITDDLSAAADIVITITDDVTGTCQFLLTITDPAPCSTPQPCSITAAGEANLACDDNDTGSDDTDDFLTIDLNPTGSMLGANYSVAVSSGTIAPASAAYGAATSFTITDDLSAAADIVITITDDVTGTCQFLLTITDPAPCSTPQPCSITAAGEANLACDDNDTGSDDTDDFLTIDLNPTGSMLGTNYSVSVSSGTIAPATAAYGAATTFTITDDLTAAADIVITITDDTDGNCSYMLTLTDPEPCSTVVPCPDVEYELCAGAGESYSLTVETGVTDIQWFLDGSPIDPADGGNDPTIIATVAGTYHYTATGLDGCDGELCCPFVLVEIDCCPAPVCMPGTMVKN